MDERFVADEIISEILPKTIVYLRFRTLHLSLVEADISSSDARKTVMFMHRRDHYFILDAWRIYEILHTRRYQKHEYKTNLHLSAGGHTIVGSEKLKINYFNS